MNKLLDEIKYSHIITKLLLVVDCLAVTFLVVYYIMFPASVRLLFNDAKAIVTDHPVEVKADCADCQALIDSDTFADILDDYTEEQLTDLHIYVVDDLTKITTNVSDAAGFQRRHEIYLGREWLELTDYTTEVITHHEIAHYLYQELPLNAKEEIKAVFEAANKQENSYASDYARTCIEEDIAETWGICHFCDESNQYTTQVSPALGLKYNVLIKYFDLVD